MNTRFEIGISAPEESFEEVLYHSSVHFGKLELKKFTKWCCTAAWPGVPGPRGFRIGERTPLLGSKSEAPEEMFWRKLEERGLYAFVMRKREYRITREGRRRLEGKGLGMASGGEMRMPSLKS